MLARKSTPVETQASPLDEYKFVGEENIIAFHEERLRPLTPDLLGELLICHLDDGRILAKRPQPGEEPGAFDLHSLHAPPLYGVRVRAVQIVTHFLPGAAARRLLAREKLARGFPPPQLVR